MRSGSMWRQCHQGGMQEGSAARSDQLQCGHLSVRVGCAVATCGADAIKETRRKGLPLVVISFSAAISACKKDAQRKHVASTPSKRRAGRACRST
eukprot:8647815-Karenia_brevis.AAC.1